MAQRYSSRSQAQRAANRGTAGGRVHDVQTHRGFFSTSYSARDTGKIANPVQRRMARRNS